MIKNVQQLVLPLALSLSSVVAFASSASAEDVELTFTGTIANTCSFANQSGGTLIHNADAGSLSTRNTGGIPASVAVSCTGPATISVSSPSTTVTFGSYLVEATRQRNNGSTQVVRNRSNRTPKTVSTSQAINDRQFDVHLELFDVGRTKNGDYTATVTLTAAPN